MKKKGQAAAELLIILAVAIVVLIAIYSFSFEAITDIGQEQIIETAQTSVKDLANATNDVYEQGVGAKKRVFYQVPGNVDESKSGIEGNAFVLNVLKSDVYASANTCLLGEMPTSTGGHFVWLTAQEQCVFVGIENLEISKTSSYITLNQSDSETDSVTITNNGEETADIFLTRNWSHTGTTDLDLDIYIFSLNAGQSQTVTLTYSSSASASGNYTGSVSIDAAFASGNESNSLPVTADVLVAGGGEILVVFPATRTSDYNAGETENYSFQVCNNGDSALTNISFSDSGRIADWIDAESIPIIALLAAGSCETVSYTLTHHGLRRLVPLIGTIIATDGTYSDNLAITVVIPAAPPEPTVIAFDVFPNSTWDEGSGWLEDWTHSGDASLRTIGNPHSLPRHLRLRRATGYVKRPVDLSSYTNPRIEFWAKAISWESGDEAHVLVSHNDSDWHTLKTWVNGEDDGVYHFYEFNLNPYTLSSEFWIAFDAEMNNKNDYFYVDDVNIVERTQ